MDSYRRFDPRDHLIHVFQSQVLTSIPRGSRKPGGRTNHIFQQHQWVLKYPLCVKIEFRETAEWNAKSRVLKKERGEKVVWPAPRHTSTLLHPQSPSPHSLGMLVLCPHASPRRTRGARRDPARMSPGLRGRAVSQASFRLCRHCYPCSTLLPGVNFLNGEQ